MNAVITLFDLTDRQGRIAEALFESVKDLPLICPHGHVDPGLFVNPEHHFENPSSLFIAPDHYICRMLVSQGVSLSELGVQSVDGEPDPVDPVAVWQIFCDHFHCFDGTPSGLWLVNELATLFDIDERPCHGNARMLYDRIQTVIDGPEFTPRKLYEAFNIEALCTTDAAESSLDSHRKLKNSDSTVRILPTFRPDHVLDIGGANWCKNIAKLEDVCGLSLTSFRAFRQALEKRRETFKSMGAVAADHGAETPFTCWLSEQDMETLFQKGVRGDIRADEAMRFQGHMMCEMARMSIEDGLVMQFHVGAYRNHHPAVMRRFGPDRGFDIPLQVSWTRHLKPLLDKFGMESGLHLILFSLDESGYARELAPLAGVYPAVKLGPPWWFHDSLNGMMRYFDQVMETAGIFNTVGFNDDTRAFLSIPARHDLWRRASAMWLAGLVCRGQLTMAVAAERLKDLAYSLAKRGYQL